MKNKGNAKAQFSQQAILEALLFLLKEKSFQDITINEITKTAQISRCTFYRNFSNKEDILQIHIQRIWTDYKKEIMNMTEISMPKVSYSIFKVMELHSSFLKILYKNKLSYLLVDHFDIALLELFKEKRALLFNEMGEEKVQYALRYSIGGFSRLAEQWILSDETISPVEMEKIMKNILFIALQDH